MNNPTAGPGTRYDTGPTVAATVADLRCAWNAGIFAGDAELVRWAEQMADSEVEATVFGFRLQANAHTPLGALVAMASYSPGRVVVTEAPEHVLDLIAGDEMMIEALGGDA